jgi:hypothetical protein
MEEAIRYCHCERFRVIGRETVFRDPAPNEM